MIQIDLTRDKNFTEQAMKLLKDYYMRPEENSPQESFARAASCYSGGDEALAQRVYEYVSKQWFMFSSPVLSNAVNEGEKVKGLPISCFLNYVPDTIGGIIENGAETRWLSVKGGGVGGSWSAVRSPDKRSPGVIPFMSDINSAMTAYKQGETRKGAYAAYLDVSHPSIQEFLQIRTPTGGDVNRKCFNIHHAVNIPDKFMEAQKARKSWPLVDPATEEVKETVDAFDLWCTILEARGRTGEPYLNFIDAANRGMHPSQVALGLKIWASNLCNEIHLPTNEERTAVCCLSSVNLEKFEEWKDTTMIEDLIVFLDNVLQFFIDHAPKELEKAVYSAMRERSLGLGAMGWHGYLQSKNIPFESPLAISQTHRIFSLIKERAVHATENLAEERGEPLDLLGSGHRNAYLLAIAPNANSSILCNCTPSIEPIKDNAYTHRTRAGTHLVKNKYLEAVLEDLGKNDDETWSQIIQAGGSVQGFDFLDDYTKDVYKKFSEVDQMWVVMQAGARQEYLCQGQSVNLSFPTPSDRQYVRAVHEKAWELGVKGLYYYRGTSGAESANVGSVLERQALSLSVGEDECRACEG